LFPVRLDAPVQSCLGVMNVSLPNGSVKLRGLTLPGIAGTTVTFHVIVQGERAGRTEPKPPKNDLEAD
jgi:hypothetical protein